MHSMKIIFKNFGKLVLKIKIDLGREIQILSICKKCIFAFFEIFTIKKSDFPKNYSITHFFLIK